MTKISQDIDQTYGEGVRLDLKPGMAWILYTDNGPGGPCGQSMRTTCPHSTLYLYSSEMRMREAIDEGSFIRNKKHRIQFGVVDNYTCGGLFRIVQDVTSTNNIPPLNHGDAFDV